MRLPGPAIVVSVVVGACGASTVGAGASTTGGVDRGGALGGVGEHAATSAMATILVDTVERILNGACGFRRDWDVALLSSAAACHSVAHAVEAPVTFHSHAPAYATLTRA